MKSDAHKSTLVRKHAQIDDQIAQLSRHPGVSATEITDLKKKKLAVKDKIRRLEDA